MAAKKKTTTKKKTSTKKTSGKRAPAKKKAAAKKARRKASGVGAVALVVRVPQSAIEYIDSARGDGPRTRFIRETLAKGDPKLAALLA